MTIKIAGVHLFEDCGVEVVPIKGVVSLLEQFVLAERANNVPCQCCRDHGCSDGCHCKQIGDE